MTECFALQSEASELKACNSAFKEAQQQAESERGALQDENLLLKQKVSLRVIYVALLQRPSCCIAACFNP